MTFKSIHSHLITIATQEEEERRSALLSTNNNMGALLTRLLEIFYTKKLDIVVIGLENRYVYGNLALISMS